MLPTSNAERERLEWSAFLNRLEKFVTSCPPDIQARFDEEVMTPTLRGWDAVEPSNNEPEQIIPDRHSRTISREN